MRPPSEPQSFLRAPLDTLLGTETNVRILRVLSEAESGALGRAEVARRARLNASGVRRALDELVELGIVEYEGAGPRPRTRLREDHPLAPDLRSLFARERERYEALVGRLRASVRDLVKPVRAAWIEGPAARGKDEPGDPLVVGILVDPGEVDEAVSALTRRTARLGGTHDVQIHVRGYTPADLDVLDEEERRSLDAAEPLYGPAPTAFAAFDEAGPLRDPVSHRVRDRQARELGRAIADRVRRDPSLTRRALGYVERRIDAASGGELATWEEWRDILANWSAARVADLLESEGERADRLRQSLPFLEVLSPAERDEVLGEGTG